MREYGNVYIAWHDACLAWPGLSCSVAAFFLCVRWVRDETRHPGVAG